jgi:outer membrane protein assembly factor BamB
MITLGKSILKRVLKNFLCLIFALQVLLSSLLTAHAEGVSPSAYEGLFVDWNTYRHDLKRTGTYYTNKPEMKGKRILFVPTNTTLYAFDGYSGAKLWEDLEDGGWIRDIICHDSMLILAKENRVVFLDATTGRSYYGIALPNVNCLLINKDMLIVVFDYNKINAYNLSNLKSPIWSKEFSYEIFNTFDEDAWILCRYSRR